jgi:hypothetical protein
MKKNMGTIDRLVRVVLAIVAGILYFTGLLSGPLGIIFLILAAVFLLTSLVGFCPLYTLLGLNTCSSKA